MTSENSGVTAQRAPQPIDDGKLMWLRFIDIGLFGLLAVFVVRYWHGNLHHWIGATVALISFTLWMTARRQLGASFAVRAEAKKLVAHGLYSKIRNPIYLFGGLAFAGEFLAMGWYWGLLALVLVHIFQFGRIKREEQVLSEAFGNEYRTYKAKTWF